MLKKKDLGRTAGPRMLSLSSKIQMARLKVKSCYSVKNWKKIQLGKKAKISPVFLLSSNIISAFCKLIHFVGFFFNRTEVSIVQAWKN